MGDVGVDCKDGVENEKGKGEEHERKKEGLLRVSGDRRGGPEDQPRLLKATVTWHVETSIQQVSVMGSTSRARGECEPILAWV